MVMLVQIVGLLIVGLGLAILISPAVTHQIFEFFKEGKRIQIAGVVRVLVGVVLFLSSSRSAVPIAANMLGAIFLLSGIIVLVSDAEKLRAFIEKYSEMPEIILRLLGLMAAAFGFLIYSIF